MWSLFHRSSHSRSRWGFTLVELLVGLIISSIFLLATSAVIINVMRVDKQEEARSEVLSELQRGLRFIENDLSEAVFVYTGEELNAFQPPPGVGSAQIPYGPATNILPILAFWKLEPTPDGTPDTISEINCFGADSGACGAPQPPSGDQTAGAQAQGLQDLTRTGFYFQLIVYFLDPNVGSGLVFDDPTFGYGRIIRYESIRPFTAGSPASSNDWYVVPQTNDFEGWPYTTVPFGTSTPTARQGPVLIPYIAEPSTAPAVLADNTCPPSPIANATYEASPVPPGTLTPNIPAIDTFYACVLTSTTGATSFSQDVILHVRGDGLGRAALINANCDDQPLTESLCPEFQTRVSLRGIFGLQF